MLLLLAPAATRARGARRRCSQRLLSEEGFTRCSGDRLVIENVTTDSVGLHSNPQERESESDSALPVRLAVNSPVRCGHRSRASHASAHGGRVDVRTACCRLREQMIPLW